MPHSQPRPLSSSISLAFLLGFTALFFTPLQIYTGNAAEFSAPVTALVVVLFAIALCTSAVLAIILYYILRKWSETPRTIILGLALLIFAQGNFLVWNYGLMNGTPIDWGRNFTRGLFELAIWIGVFFSIFRFRRIITPYVPQIAVFLIAVQSVTATVRLFSLQSHPHQYYAVDGRELMTFSPEENVIFIITDALQSTTVDQLRSQLPDFSAAFEGFTFFRNATSGYTSTMGSIPNMMTGRFYTNERPLPEFLEDAYSSSIFTMAGKLGYRVEVYPLVDKVYWFDSNVIDNLVKESAFTSAGSITPELFAMSAFRHLPHFAKRIVFGGDSRFSRGNAHSASSASQDLRRLPTGLGPVRDKTFHDRLAEMHRADSSRKRFKLIHLGGAHAPYGLDENLQLRPLPDDLHGYTQQAKACLRILQDFFEELKKHGLYDSSTIVVTADHGVWFNTDYTIPAEHQSSQGDLNQVGGYVVAAGLPAVLIKPANRHGKLSVNDAPVQLADFPATVSALLDPADRSPFPGRSMFEVSSGEDRERRHYYYDFEGWDHRFLPELNEYIIRGFSWNPASWRATGEKFRPYGKRREIPRLPIGEWKAFGTGEPANALCGPGWGIPEEKHIWSSERTAQLTIAVEKPQALLVRLDLVPFVRPQKVPEQSVFLSTRGKALATWRATSPGEYLVGLPKNAFVEGVATIDMRFPDARSPSRDLGESPDPRTLAISLRRIRLDPIHDLPDDLVINFGSEGNYQLYAGNGWSRPDPKSTWSIGEHTELLFTLSQIKEWPATFQLSVAGTPVIIPDKVESNTLAVAINGRNVATWDVTGYGVHSAQISLDGPGPHTLSFEPGTPVTPADVVPGNGDTRALGFSFNRIEFIKAQP